jgi:L-iditol 2-dehydrogenase
MRFVNESSAAMEEEQEFSRVVRLGGPVSVVLPEPGAGEVVARLRCALVLPSDLLDFREGRIPGRALVADVVACGEDAPFRLGQRIFPAVHAPCGICEACRSGSETNCLDWKASALVPGGLASRFLVPAWNARRGCLALPADDPPEAQVFLEPLAAILRKLSRVRGRKVHRILVCGSGMPANLWGLALEALYADARRFLVGIAEDARNFGYHEVLSEPTAQADAPDLIVLLEALPEQAERALDLLSVGGTLVTEGEACCPVSLDLLRLSREEKMLAWAKDAGPEDLHQALDLLPKMAGRLPGLIGARISLEQWASQEMKMAPEPWTLLEP